MYCICDMHECFFSRLLNEMTCAPRGNMGCNFLTCAHAFSLNGVRHAECERCVSICVFLALRIAQNLNIAIEN